ncbi:outer membrane beta-barrel protein [Methylocystis sp. WRRC1]|uniref:outer membrane protein n=1 Tax=unclassified Methylocystis TaxID=2625913 RepID=UPI0001F87C77|nr:MULTISPECIES: outer membrane beta-barrel protein [unclassified Methylocystis]MCC3243765.1 outer membrane beta-barrel protein [Methylocystis sp. WRRC1]
MRKIAFSVAVLALTAGSALAADLPSRKEAPVYVPPPPPPMWVGFYVGLNAGGTWAASTNSASDAWGLANGGTPIHGWVAAASAASWQNGGNNSGFIGGGQIGYNWQFMNSFIAGVEADIQGVAGNSPNRDIFGSSFDPISGTNIVTFGNRSSRLDYLGTVRGRLGWLFTPTMLVYGTGGLAYGGVSTSATFVTSEIGFPFNSVASASFADTRVGWTAGGGIEWMFMPNWSAKVEYLYYDLGTVSATAVAVEPTVVDWAYSTTVRQRFNGNMVRAGLNYHFNWGAAPVVAKY